MRKTIVILFCCIISATLSAQSYDEISDVISYLTGEQFSPFLKHIRAIHSHGTVEDDVYMQHKHTSRCHRGDVYGKTDHQYFNDIVFQQADINATPKKIIFYYYGEKERLKLMKEIDTLTGQRLGSLQMNNDILFFDSSNTDYEISHKF